MLSYAIVAMILIVVAALIYLGYTWDETQRHLANSSDEQNRAYAEIMKARLRSEGKLVGPEEYEPDFTPVVIAVILIALCAIGGMGYCTGFFVLCFAAICFNIADVIKMKLVVDWVESNVVNLATA